MSDKTTEYIILRAVFECGNIKTALVNGESYREDKLAPKDYFPRAKEITEAKEMGIIQVLGDTDLLDDIYLSD